MSLLPPRWGWPGLAALLGLLLAAPLALWLTPHWIDEAQSLRRQRPAAPRPVVVVAPPALPQLPEAGVTEDRVARLLALAPRHGVAVDSVQQRLDASGPLPRLQLVLAVRGAYGDLRDFVDGALRADAALSLDQLRLQRPDARAAMLRGDLRLALLLPVSDAASGP